MNGLAKIATVTLNPAIDQTVSIPGFQAGRVNRVQSTRSDPGGKGVNVASILADLGFPVAVTGFLGEENTQIFERLFAQKHIDDRFVRIAGSTRTGIKIVDETVQETTDVNFPGQAPSAADLRSLFSIVEDLAADCDWFVLSGSIPDGVDGTVYRDLVELIRARRRAVALDTSGDALRQAVAMGPTLVKPNIDELQEYTGRTLGDEAAVIRAAWEWLDEGIQTVVVSMGARGALFVEAQEVVRARPPHVNVKSTVGAGDAMVSGTVAGKAQGSSLGECARLATAFSLAAITRVQRGLPDQTEMPSIHAAGKRRDAE